MNADKIMALASRKEGVTYYEANDAVSSKSIGCAGAYITSLIRAKKLFKSGVKDFQRYFANKVDADAYQIEADVARLVRLADVKKKRNAANVIRMKNKRAEMRQAKPPKPAKQKPVKPEKPKITPKQRAENKRAKERKRYAERRLKALLDKKPKAQNIVIETKQQAIDKKRTHLKAVIEWPEHVKVQVIEGFKGDTRYQPAPGYVGSFTREWQQRRAA